MCELCTATVVTVLKQCYNEIVRRYLMTAAKKLDSTIGLRISGENKDIIRMAAKCMGQDLTSYLISTVLARAKKDILEHSEMQSILLSKRDFEKVEKELDTPSRASARLKKAFKEHSKKVKE